MIKSVKIEDRMVDRASIEAKKRNPDIKHHFNVEHLTEKETDIIGFLGEFAACKYFGIDWENNIRKNYKTIDSGDGSIGDIIFDVKTETIPEYYFNKVVNRTINDSEPYGKRWINKNQVSLLKKYNIIIFGAFKRHDYSVWYPIGWLEANTILSNYIVTNEKYNKNVTPALKVETSALKSMSMLLEQYKGEKKQC